MARSSLRAVAIAAALACVGVSGAARAEDGPPLRYPPTSVRPKLVLGGLAVTGSAYGASVLFSQAWPEVPGSDALKVPVVGPWVSLAQNDCSPDGPDCGFILYARGFLLILDGLIQAGGVGVMGEGLFMTTEAPAKKATLDVHAVPVVTASATGLGVVGSF